MNYKEKYEKALEKAQELIINENGMVRVDRTLLEDIFPELKESEDEKIRKRLLAWLKSTDGQTLPMDEYNAAIAWLEKQGNLIVELQKTYVEIGRLVKENCYLKEKQDEQKSVEWSGVDNAIVEGICLALEYSNESGEAIEKYENWLHSIKDRVLPINEVLKQKPVDMEEPKFKVGDWIITPENKVLQITSIESTNYRFNNESHYWEICYCDEKCHLWTIKDAKDGDVLLSPGTPEGDKECPFIFKEIEDGIVRFHVALLQSEELKIADGITNVMGYANAGYHIPATKEQRDLLFQKMKESGYMWDAEKKELKKIEQKPAWSEKDRIRIANCIQLIGKTGDGEVEWLKSLESRILPQVKQEWSEKDEKISKAIIKYINGESDCLSVDLSSAICWIKNVKDRVLPKQEWSKDDETFLNTIISDLDYSKSIHNKAKCNFIDKEIKWIKSLKDRVQPKKEWRKEDENNILFLTSVIEECFKNKEKITLCGDTACANFTKEDVIDRLKSLRSHSHWKPSDEQMDALYTYIYNPQYFNSQDPRMELVESVYQDLKKLREE